MPGELKVMVCAVGGAAETVKDRETVVAGAKVLFPAWLASMMQVPATTRVNVLPLTVQMLGVVDAKLTGRPELAVAVSTGGAVPRVWLPGELKVMVCAVGGAAETVKDRETVVAGA